ncbi:MAG: hypothetical protein AABX38_01520 [Candidatus Micrarchaeota archaeon]
MEMKRFQAYLKDKIFNIRRVWVGTERSGRVCPPHIIAQRFLKCRPVKEEEIISRNQAKALEKQSLEELKVKNMNSDKNIFQDSTFLNSTSPIPYQENFQQNNNIIFDLQLKNSIITHFFNINFKSDQRFYDRTETDKLNENETPYFNLQCTLFLPKLPSFKFEDANVTNTYDKLSKLNITANINVESNLGAELGAKERMFRNELFFLDTEYNSTLIPQVKDMNLDLGYSKIDFQETTEKLQDSHNGDIFNHSNMFTSLIRMDKDDKIEYKSLDDSDKFSPRIRMKIKNSPKLIRRIAHDFKSDKKLNYKKLNNFKIQKNQIFEKLKVNFLNQLKSKQKFAITIKKLINQIRNKLIEALKIKTPKKLEKLCKEVSNLARKLETKLSKEISKLKKLVLATKGKKLATEFRKKIEKLEEIKKIIKILQNKKLVKALILGNLEVRGKNKSSKLRLILKILAKLFK